MARVPPAVARAVDLTLEATVALSFSRVGSAVRSRLEAWQPVEQLPGAGHRVLVTGANAGLGAATTRALLAAGARVVMTVRDPDRGAHRVAALARELGPGVVERVSVETLDLSDLGSVRALAARELARGEPLSRLIHNAGALTTTRTRTADGLELTYQVHVVAPVLLTTLLLPKLAASSPSRVVTVTSGGMYAERLDVDTLRGAGTYRGATAYAQAKRAQVVLTRLATERCGGRGVSFHAAHPGWADTPGVRASLPRFRALLRPWLRTPAEGADTIVHLALAGAVPAGGRPWHDRRPRSEHRLPWTREAPAEAERLWVAVHRDAGLAAQG